MQAERCLHPQELSYFIDSGYTSLNKKGEELCGDRVECTRNAHLLFYYRVCDGQRVALDLVELRVIVDFVGNVGKHYEQADVAQ